MMRILIVMLGISSAGSAWSAGFDHAHAGWDRILKAQSAGGFVAYKTLKKNLSEFNAYIAELGAVTRTEEKAWDRQERLAFWINAYNAFTIKAILDNYPPKASNIFKEKLYGKLSIRHISKVWDKRIYRAAGRVVSLNDIEHKILRKDLSEPRIHFAIVCASIGCPPLRGEAYVATSLGEQFEDNIKVFLKRKENFALDLAGREVGLSPILKWFYEDFTGFDDGRWGRYPKKARGGLAFLSKSLPAAAVRSLQTGSYDFEWLSYDWSLNQR